MKKYKIVLLLFILGFATFSFGQEIQSKVTIISSRIPTSVDKQIFTELQKQLTNFINNRKWTPDVFQPQEKIDCNILLNMESVVETDVYKASLTIQAARPVFNSSYSTALINFQDADVTFRYVKYQQLEFNENRVQGTDPLAGNLTAIIAYYADIILGLDYDSFSAKSGETYFQKAQNIVNNAPENKSISGWKSFDGSRNRYWLAENFQNTRFNAVHDVIYSYYRLGLDFMYEKEAGARTQMLNALLQLQTVNQENPNSMIVAFFMAGKYQELSRIFKKATPPEKSRVIEALQKLDVANIAKYQQDLK